MSDLFKRDNVTTGLLLALGSEVVTGLLVWLGLIIANLSVESHIRWFGLCFVPPILLLRYFAKLKQHSIVTKTIIIVLFVSFILFMLLLFMTKSIVL